MTRLIILDHLDAVAPLRSAAPGPADVLLLGTNAEWASRSGSAMDSSWRVLDQQAAAHSAADETSAAALAVAQSLAAPDFRRAIGAAGTEWWWLEVTEVSPFRGRLVRRIYALSLVRRALSANRYDEIVIAVKDRRLAEAILKADLSGIRVTRIALPFELGTARHPVWSQLRSVAATACRAIATRLILPRATATAPRSPIAIFSFFPAWWNLDPGRSAPSERFFAAPPGDAPIVWWLWISRPGFVWRYRAALRNFLATRPCVLLEDRVSVGDCFSLLSWRRLAGQRRFERRDRHRLSIPWNGFDLGPIAADDVSESLSGSERFQNILLNRAIRRASATDKPRVLMFRCESQPSEAAVNDGAVGVPRAGFMHYPFDYLPLRVASADKAAGRPSPSHMLVCGAAGVDRMRAAGWSDADVRAWGSQRHPSLRAATDAPPRAALRIRLGWPAGARVLLVAPAIVESDTEALVAAVCVALEHDATLRLVVRTHPNYPAGHQVLAVLRDVAGSRWLDVPAATPLYDLLRAADALTTIGSTLAFESLAVGTPVVILENPATFPANTLREYEPAVTVVAGGRELAAVLNEIWRQTTDARERHETGRRAAAAVLGDLSAAIDAQWRDVMAGWPPSS